MLTERGDMGIINFVRWTTQMKAKEKQGMERYRSGHNEAVLKTVCPQGRGGSNPTLSAQARCLLRRKRVSVIGELPKLAEGAPLERE